MGDIAVFRFFFPIFLVLWMFIPLVGSAVDAKDVTQLAAREAARQASISNDANAVDQKALGVITGSGKPISYNGVTLFDPSTDVNINFYNGNLVTVTVTYRHYLISPNMLTIMGGDPIGPTITLTSQASFERSW